MNELNFLRLGDEPSRHYTEKTIHEALMTRTHEFMDLLESFYDAWSEDPRLVQQPPKTIFTSRGIKGDWRVMPCVIDRFEGALIKAVKVIGTNEEERTITDKICVGKALLIDEYDNHIKASFDVCALSSFRTAAISALACKHTCPTKANRLLIVGAGRIGFYLASILSRWGKAGKLVFQDAIPARAEALAKYFSGSAQGPTLDIEGCDAVFLCTDSASPILNAGNVGEARFISSVGADADNLSEVDPSLLTDFTVVSESRQNIHIGDMARWKQSQQFSADQIVELTEVFAGQQKLNPRILFISTGTAAQDALACHFVFQQDKRP